MFIQDTPCHIESNYQHFRDKYCLQLKGRYVPTSVLLYVLFSLNISSFSKQKFCLGRTLTLQNFPNFCYLLLKTYAHCNGTIKQKTCLLLFKAACNCNITISILQVQKWKHEFSSWFAVCLWKVPWGNFKEQFSEKHASRTLAQNFIPMKDNKLIGEKQRAGLDD